MSSSNLKSPKENIASIPIYFSNHLPSKKDILIGKVQLQDKNNYKVVPIKSENQGTKTIKSESKLCFNEIQFKKQGNSDVSCK